MVATITALVFLGALLSPAAARVPDDGDWYADARFAFNLSLSRQSHADVYPGVSGIGDAERSTDWLARLRSRLQRHLGRWEEDHRFNVSHGRSDGDIIDDEIDVSSLIRWEVWPGSRTHYYGRARGRTNIDNFNQPTRGDLSAGLGRYWLDSERWGVLETLLGLRANRRWNTLPGAPPEDSEWDSFYEFYGEYEVEIREGVRYSTELELFTPTEDVQDYTLRWDGRVTVDLLGWVDLQYSYTTYYEREERTVATRSLTTVNIVYEWENREQQTD